MARQAILRTGTSEAGYTLLELLTVLAIISVMIAVTAGYRSFGNDGLRAKNAGELVRQELIRMRSKARLEGTVTGLRLGHDGLSLIDVAGHRRFEPGSGIEISFEPAGDGALVGVPREILFYPQGGSTGGDFILRAGQAVERIQVDWLTARVARVEGKASK